MTYYADKTIFLNHLLKTDKQKTKEVSIIFEKAKNGEIKLLTSIYTVFEVYQHLQNLHSGNKEKIVQLLRKLVNLDFIEFLEGEPVRQAVEIYAIREGVRFDDSYYSALVQKYNFFDTPGLDKIIPGAKE